MQTTINTLRVLNQYGIDVVAKAKGNLKIYGFNGQKKSRRKQSTGALGEGLFYFIETGENGGIVISFLSEEDYAAIVEDGRKAGSKRPPIDAIERWIKEKPIRLRELVRRNKEGEITNQDTAGRFIPMTKENIRGAAFGIAAKIGKDGIEGIKFFARAMNEEFEKLPEPLISAIIRDVEDMIIDNFVKTNTPDNATIKRI